MKNLRKLQGIVLLFILAFFVIRYPQFSSAKSGEINNTMENQQSIPYLEDGMYLIIGAFQIGDNALQYSRKTSIKGKRPSVGRYKGNGLYYVYAYKTKDDLDYAREKRTELRRENQFYDAWILYVGIKLQDLLPNQVEETPDVVAINQPKEIANEKLKVEDKAGSIPPPPVQQDENLYNYRFNVVSATTLKEVPGYVTIIDASRDKAMKSVSTNQIHQLEAPNSQSKEIIALCDIFGFVKEQVKFKIDDPMSSEDQSMIDESGGITTIKFQLARHKVGDILTMYNVYFYTNSAIMKPESKFELNSLLGMLKENDKLEIRIHGHTNGNSPGKLITLREDDNNYFAVTPNNIELTSSAKDLSKARAEIIKRWLVDQGIDEKRMELKGWGGKKMIYKKNDAMAGKNVRVEVEILKG
ncbi:MAG: OmpA family protein [Cyclobacteriaceae bacterium]|nr:OmpA family protein [Cyclobacteriaceae bacterium]